MMMHPIISPTDATIHSKDSYNHKSSGSSIQGLLPAIPTNNLELKSLLHQEEEEEEEEEDTTDNDDYEDCSSLDNNNNNDNNKEENMLMMTNDNNTPNNLQPLPPPGLASTSSGSSCCSDNNNNKTATTTDNDGGDSSLRNNNTTTHNPMSYTTTTINAPPPPQQQQQQQQYKHNSILTHLPPTTHSIHSHHHHHHHHSTNNNGSGQPITPLHNIPYVHGGYAAAAPLFVTHSKFVSILKRLLPGAYLELRGLLSRNDLNAAAAGVGGGGSGSNGNGGGVGGERDFLREYSMSNDLVDDDSRGDSSVQHHPHHPSTNNNNSTNYNSNNNNYNNNICITDPVKIMKWAENNPIVSAFGVWNSDNGRRTKRFMQGVVVVKQGRDVGSGVDGIGGIGGGGIESGVRVYNNVVTSSVGGGEEKLKQRQRQEVGVQQETFNDNNDDDGEGSPLRLRLKERIDRSRRRSSSSSSKPTTSTTSPSTTTNDDVIDEQHHLSMLLQSLSTTNQYSSNEENNNVFDLSFRDRGNSSVVEAVQYHPQSQQQQQQRLLKSYQKQQQQQHPHHPSQHQRKREMSTGTTTTTTSTSSLSPMHLPPLPPSSLSSSTRNSSTYNRQLTPPPPGSTLLKGGGMSGPGGVSSPRRKIPLPSDLPNSSNATISSIEGGGGGGGNEYGMNGNAAVKQRTQHQRRSLSLTNTSYDAYLNEHRQHHHHHHPYNRQRTNSSSSGFDTTDYTHPPSSSSSHHNQQQYFNKPAIEWDIFLDPQLVRLVDAALTVVDNLETKLHKIRLKRERIRQQRRKERNERRLKRKRREEMRIRMRMNGGGFGKRGNVRSLEDDDGEDDDDDGSTGSSCSSCNDDLYDDDEDFDLLQAHTAAQVEVDRLVAQLMRRTIIAHGSMSQLVLEGLGWAPEYNFGRVVKCSREGTNLPSPQRRNGSGHHQLSFSDTLSWDEEEEQRDFEALLDRRIHVSSVASGARGGGVSGGGAATTGKGGSTTHHSKGMFMEKWLSLFAKSLTLLVRSTNSSSGGGGGDGGDGNDIVKLSSSSSSVPLEKKKSGDTQQLAKTKKKKKSVTVTNKPEEQGLTSYLSSLFFGSDKTDTIDYDGNDEDSDKENDNDDDDDNSAHLTNHDMFSPATTTAPKGGILRGLGCGMSLCLGMDDDEPRFNCGTSTGQTSNSVFPLNPHASHQMARDIQRINDVLGEPLRLVLDLKSRRVPPRVWSRLIDNLRSRGLLIEGIGSFDMDELRVIGKGCSYPLTPILFFHSVGDLQRACHANEVKKGDTVYFNGGSLMWKRSSIMEAAECGGCCGQINIDDENEIQPNNAYRRASSTATAATTSARTLNANGDYSFQPYAYPRSALSDWERVQCKSTIEDYRRHFDLKIGVYVQEFSISAEALEELTVFVNQHGDLYDQGIAFGGVNGVAVKNISGDGYWNQRYMGRSWDFNARPSKEMTPLKPEDHHLVQVAIQAGAWGQVGTIYEVNDEQKGALTVPPPREPCMHIGID